MAKLTPFFLLFLVTLNLLISKGVAEGPQEVNEQVSGNDDDIIFEPLPSPLLSEKGDKESIIIIEDSNVNETTEVDDVPDVNQEYTRCMETIIQHEGYEEELCPYNRYGAPGIPGLHGLPGIPGLPGRKGDAGDCEDCVQDDDMYVPNMKQCAWNMYNFALSVGPVQTCSFIKKKKSTVLMVEWHGATRLKCSQTESCCSRWYFLFDGTECLDPQPIDAIIFLSTADEVLNFYKTMSIVGSCRGLSAGVHDVTLWVGECNGGYERGLVRTGWNSSSRIIIRELPYH
ncbi:unnamed protein product [Clavelina lepadiformis]|uniref:CTHRC1 C-terminal domain-containing protein n=1 Tax=Clavelina lepadiformis TaxID=159417 RepID=A0ABP0FEU8_CLALP